jgi:hypothetical protein
MIKEGNLMHSTTWLHLAARKSLTVVFVVALSANADGQTVPPGGATKPKPVDVETQPACAEAEFKQACASYAELLAAKDAILAGHSTPGKVTSVCLRPKTDSFFVLSIGAPTVFSKVVIDGVSAKRIPDATGTSPAIGFVTEFVDGIATTSTMPINTFGGEWSSPSTPFFLATTIDLRDFGAGESLSVNPTQMLADVIYSNRQGKKISYRLRIQRSTGRFTEQYTEEGANTPFSEHRGRCLFPAAFK